MNQVAVKILNEKPPEWIWKEAEKCFAFDPHHTIFTFGNSIFNPGGHTLSPDIIHHELVHVRQQKGSSKDATLWWKKYFKDTTFRLEQEIEAYSAQYRFFCKYKKDRNLQSKFLMIVASHLSSPMYGDIISLQEAMKKIKI